MKFKLKFFRYLTLFTLIVGIYLTSNNAHLGKVSAAATSGQLLSSFEIRSHYEKYNFEYVSADRQQYLYSIDGVTTQTGSTVPAKAKWATLSSFEIRSHYEKYNFEYVSADRQQYLYSIDGVTTQTGSTVPANAKWATLSSFEIRSHYEKYNFEYVSADRQQYLYSIDGVTTQTGSTVPAKAKWATLSSFEIRSHYGKYNFEYVSADRQQYLNYIINSDPVINIVSNGNPTLSEGGTATLSGTVNDPDGDIVTISATVGGKAKSTTVTGSGSWSLTWSGSELAEGTYSNIVISANDGKGGTASVTYTGTITIDKTKPVISLVGLLANATYQESVAPTFSAADSGSGLQSVSAMIDGASYTSGTLINTPGSHSLVITATDKAGNVNTQTTLFFINKSPTMILSTPVTHPPLVEATGLNDYILAGSIKDLNVGDQLTIKYRINGGPTFNGPTIVGNSNDQPFNFKLILQNKKLNYNGTDVSDVLVDDQTVTIDVWVEDNKLGSSSTESRSIVTDLLPDAPLSEVYDIESTSFKVKDNQTYTYPVEYQFIIHKMDGNRVVSTEDSSYQDSNVYHVLNTQPNTKYKTEINVRYK
ncbi:Ig-like domain-containing protein [Schinkia azotoformans]|uniref:OmpL47-type beta-barrel domain-containing protein n=1 Tax=Schinkia azotoformans TaxID=1454 RepID=UPI002E251B07|nr:Ig-like domain-containing protein [Schinkia azotoformans]